MQVALQSPARAALPALASFPANVSGDYQGMLPARLHACMSTHQSAMWVGKRPLQVHWPASCTSPLPFKLRKSRLGPHNWLRAATGRWHKEAMDAALEDVGWLQQDSGRVIFQLESSQTAVQGVHDVKVHARIATTRMLSVTPPRGCGCHSILMSISCAARIRPHCNDHRVKPVPSRKACQCCNIAA